LQWFHNSTTSNARRALLIIEYFLHDARNLYQTMTGIPWK